MRILTLTDIQHISGGDFLLTGTLRVAGPAASQVLYIFGQYMTGEVVDAATLAAALTANNTNITDVRIESLAFDDFN